MKRLYFLFLVVLGLGRIVSPAAAAPPPGPYDPQVGFGATEAIAKDDPRIIGWATAGTIERGLQRADDPGLGSATFGTVADAFGVADATVSDSTPTVSLGDGGAITMSFGFAFSNNPGPDFAVFENGIVNPFGIDGSAFLELGHVEVSSDGSNFFRFESASLTQTDVQVGTFGSVNAADLYNLGGKYIAGYGTPFDLEELDGTVGLDINAVTHVRIIDVVGSINPAYGSMDSLGNLINDAFPTPFPSSGFDLDAIAILVPEPTGATLLLGAGIALLARRRRHHHPEG